MIDYFFILALSLLIGTTIADNATIIAQNPTIGFSTPSSIQVNKTTDNSIIVTSLGGRQVISFYDNGLTINNVLLIAKNWSGGNLLPYPFAAFVQPNQKSNLYVCDRTLAVVIKIFNMQVISPLPTIVAGVRGIFGSATNRFSAPDGIAVDSNENLYVVDTANNRIMLWPPNSTYGTVIAGLNVTGNDSFSLHAPFGIFLDENNSYIYISDTYNYRIQRFSLLGGSPNNGTTVAGGNGQGSSNKQLNLPYGVYISKKTKAIYIADTYNNRIQRWNQGDQSGVTIAGDPNGNAGSNATMLNGPYGIALNDEETFLYVADTNNNRIQRFQLV
jgi:sugar lactone lactonase YvrE